ncbi:MAG: dTMP kinase [Candidatus Chromulinivorax sp.]
MKNLLITISIIHALLLTIPMHALNQGYLFSIEGTEGCGKTTLIKNLEEALSHQNIDVITTREPGATDLGKSVRSMLMNRSVPTCLLSEFLLFAADRAQHFHELILPALGQHKIVICDRMADSSLVYQGYVKGLDQEIIKTINNLAMQERKPNLVFYLKIDAQTSCQRINGRNQTEKQDAFEAEILQKKQMLIDGYDAILTNRSDVMVIDATQDAQTIANQILQAILAYIKKND